MDRIGRFFMDAKVLCEKIKEEGRKFLNQVARSSEPFFLALFCIYIISNIMYMIGWQLPLLDAVWNVHVILFTIVMWFSAIYLFSIIIEWRQAWKRIIEVVLIGLFIFIVTALISRTVTRDYYAGIMGVYFLIMAHGKNYKKILYCFLILTSGTLLLGFIGMLCGFTFDAAKPERVYGGHSLGILYPNNWGFLVFAVLILVWYLWLRGKKILTLFLFWIVAVFMYKYIDCRTIAVMAFLFPIIAIIAEIIQGNQEPDPTVTRRNKTCKPVRYILLALPFFAFAGMMFGCWQMDWFHDSLYGTKLHTLAMRFVEGGYCLRLNGVSLFGHPTKYMEEGIISYTKELDLKVDSAYVIYVITRGIAWMGLLLAWISAAHNRCLKTKDYRLLCISCFMLLFSMMERPGLDVWYNFVLLYPLAAISDAGSKKNSSAGNQGNSDGSKKNAPIEAGTET